METEQTKDNDVASAEQANDKVLSKNEFMEMATSAKTEITALPYKSASKHCNLAGSYTPTKLYYESQKALSVFAERGIDTTSYVREKLKYKSNLAVCKAFFGEQVDAIALAVFQIEENNATFIIGDGTGVGKGRTAAGMLRYAYQKGKIPVFFTETTSLFNSIYRDIIDIDGFGDNGELPKPFILNGCGTFDKDEKRYENDIVVDDKVLFSFAKNGKGINKEECIETLEKKGLPNGYDIILATYNVLSADKDSKNEKAQTGVRYIKAILDYMQKNEERIFLLLDESHGAAGEGSNTNKNFEILQSTKAEMIYSSATYAKRYDNLKFYLGRTSMKDSGVTQKAVLDFVDNFKENGLEFISQGLAESGQMVRRERSLAGCDIEYRYQPEKRLEQYAKFDSMILLLGEIIAFTRSADYKKAVAIAETKIAKELGLKLASMPKPSGKMELDEWKKNNNGNYYPYSKFTNAVKDRRNWVDNLMFAIKADFAIEKVLEYLKGEYEYENKFPDGSADVAKTNLKPLIVVKNTGAANLNIIPKPKGQPLTEKEMDFSYTLVHVLDKCMNGTTTFSKVILSGKKEEIVKPISLTIDLFDDKGVAYNKLLDAVNNTMSGLPISPLDKLMNTINSTERERGDYDHTKSTRYIVEDTTKRNIMIGMDANGNYILTTPNKENNSAKIARFNNGKADCIIINESAATGESMHSSPKYKDIRKRVMLMYQPEYNVTTEMQKIGRVNRSGQINLPQYDYIVSMIPSEVRRLMSLKKKLRTLSANTTGNMNQANSYSDVKDAENNPIEDCFTKYGWQVLEVFLSENNEYRSLVPAFDKWMQKKITDEEKFIEYCRVIEGINAERQQFFYNEINRMYREKRLYLTEKGEWDLDSNIINYRASVKSRAILYRDTDENTFKASVYLQDVYVTAQSKPHTKEEVLALIKKYTRSKREDTWHNEFLSDVLVYVKEYKERQLGKLLILDETATEDEDGEPLTEEAIQEIKDHNANSKEECISRVDEMFSWLLREDGNGYLKGVLKELTIGKKCVVPFDEKVILRAWADYDDNKINRVEYEEKISMAGMVLAKFIGYKIDGDGSILNPSNINLVFATLGGIGAEFRIKPTRHNRSVIEDFIVPKSNRLHGDQLREIEAWKVVAKPRVLVKTVTGNLLKGLDVYDKMKQNGDRIRICSYTTIDGSIEKAIVIQNAGHIEGKYPDDPHKSPMDIPKEAPFFVAVNDDSVVRSRAEFPLSDGFSVITRNELRIYYNGYRKKGGVEEAYPLSIYANRVSELKELADRLGIYNRKGFGVLVSVWVDGQRSEKRKRVDYFTVSFTKEIADYFFDISKEYVFGNAVTLEYRNPDVFTEKDEKRKKDVKGIYEYACQKKYDASITIPDFISFEESDDFQNGIVKTEYQLTALESERLNLVPINVISDIGYQRFISQLKEQRNLEKFIIFATANKGNFLDVYIEGSKLTMLPLKYFFGTTIQGDMSYPNIGRIIVSKITNEEIPAEEEVEVEQEYEKIEIPLNVETAQDFLIKFTV